MIEIFRVHIPTVYILNILLGRKMLYYSEETLFYLFIIKKKLKKVSYHRFLNVDS